MKFKKTFLYALAGTFLLSPLSFAESVDTRVTAQQQEQQDRQPTQSDNTPPSSSSQNEGRKAAQKMACPGPKVVKKYDSYSARRDKLTKKNEDNFSKKRTKKISKVNKMLRKMARKYPGLKAGTC
jgi:hypothetical protein